MTENWFAIQAKPRKEALAEFHLKRQGFDTFFPHYRNPDWTPKPGSKYLADFMPKRPYLIGYLFVEAPLETLAAIYNTIGVSTIVGIAKVPFPVPYDIVSELKSLANEHGEILIGEKPKDQFDGRPGDRVRIKPGNSLWGFWGEIRRVCPKHLVLKLEKAMAGQSEISISKDDVEIVRVTG